MNRELYSKQKQEMNKSLELLSRACKRFVSTKEYGLMMSSLKKLNTKQNKY